MISDERKSRAEVVIAALLCLFVGAVRGAAPEPRVLAGHQGAVGGVAFSADGETIFSCGSDETIRAWQLQEGGSSVVVARHKRGMQQIAVSPNGAIAATGDESGSVQVWSLSRKRLLQQLSGHRGKISRVLIPKDRPSRLVTASLDWTVRLWDLADTHESDVVSEHQHDEDHEGVVDCVVDATGNHLVTAVDWSVGIWDLQEKRRLARLDQMEEVTSVALSPAATEFCAACGHEEWEFTVLRFWRWEDRQKIGSAFITTRARVNSICYSPDGKRIALAGDELQHDNDKKSTSYSIWLLDVTATLEGRGGEPHPALEGYVAPAIVKIYTGHTKIVRQVVFSPDGKLLASCSYDGTIRLWPVPE